MNKECRMAAKLTFWTYDYSNRVWDPESPSPAVTCQTGGGMKMKVLVRMNGTDNSNADR